MLGRQPGAESEQHRPGGRIEHAADPATLEESPCTVQPGRKKHQIAERQDGMASGESEDPADPGASREELRHDGKVEDEDFGVGDIGEKPLAPTGEPHA